MCVKSYFCVKLVLQSPKAHIEELLNVVEEVSKKSPGAHVKPPIKNDKNFFNSLFKSKTALNDPKIDNRIAYLTLKGTLLRGLQRNEESLTCLNVVNKIIFKSFNYNFYRKLLAWKIS